MHDEMEETENEEVKEEKVKIEEDSDNGLHNLEEVVDEIVDTFEVRSSQGVSINGTGFCRGIYSLGQLVGSITIDEEIRNNILSLDAESIRTNPHHAM